MHTKDFLASRLREAGLHKMAKQAKGGYYSELCLNSLTGPGIGRLCKDLAAAIEAGCIAAVELRARLHNREFDALFEIEEDRTETDEARATFNILRSL